MKVCADCPTDVARILRLRGILTVLTNSEGGLHFASTLGTDEDGIVRHPNY